MGRNKLSPSDRIKKFGYYTEKVRKVKQGDVEPIIKEIRTIRSKALRTFILFWMSQLDEYTFAVDYSIKELSKSLGVGDRTIHDYIKARKILSAIEEVSFEEILNGLGNLKDEKKQRA